MQELVELLTGASERPRLDLAALQLSAIENPALGVEPYVLLLDSHAAEFGERVTPRTPPDEFLDLLNQYLFDELGFQGNSLDYYDPANSCLQEVLTRRLGIPITLSVVYMEIGRRLGRQIHGIGLPGHFLVALEDDEVLIYADPFHGGNMLSEEECYDLAREATGMDLANDPAMLHPVSKRQIMLRMLNNLRAIYFRRKEHGKALQVLDLLIRAAPSSAEEYKQRGICLAQLERFGEAQQNLETYLQLAPGAQDRQQVLAEIQRLSRMIALQD